MCKSKSYWLATEKIDNQNDCEEPLKLIISSLTDFETFNLEKSYIESLKRIYELVRSFSVWVGEQDEMTPEEVSEFGSYDLDGKADGDGHEILEAMNEIESLANDLKDEIDL